MRAQRSALVFAVLAITAIGYGQDNACAYTFTYPQYEFSFCATEWGTIASIQSPIGVNHLDTANPVEGWSAFILDAGGGGDGTTIIPGLGTVSGDTPPPVFEPNGPGTFPLIFEYDGPSYRETVRAVPVERKIILTITIASCNDCYWYGEVSRVANIRADGNAVANFAHSSFSAFGYATHGVMLGVAEGSAGIPCTATDPNGASASTYLDCSLGSAPFNGPGAVYAVWGFESQYGQPESMKATYTVF